MVIRQNGMFGYRRPVKAGHVRHDQATLMRDLTQVVRQTRVHELQPAKLGGIGQNWRRRTAIDDFGPCHRLRVDGWIAAINEMQLWKLAQPRQHPSGSQPWIKTSVVAIAFLVRRDDGSDRDGKMSRSES